MANIRLEFPWRFLEPGPSSYDWTRADMIVSSASHIGVDIQPVLVYSPSWIAEDPTTPPDGKHFGAFVTAIVNRYKAHIHYWELWNEPDLPRYWSGSVQEYVEAVLRPGSVAIRAADSTAQVILGGPHVANLSWLGTVYACGGRDNFDIMAFHDYSASAGQILSNARAIQSALHTYGHAHKRIWLGEFGIQEHTIRDTRQQTLIRGVLTQRGPIALAQWYNLRDDYAMTCCPPSVAVSEYYGLVQHDDNAPKDGYRTMQTLLVGSAQAT